MAASTLTNLANGLRRIYSEETFEYAQNAASPLVELMEEAKDLTPEGAGYYWPFMLRSPQNIGTPAEDGNIPPIKQRTEVQGHVNAGQFVGAFEISFMLEAAGSARGTWNKGEVKKHSFDTLHDLVKHRNRIYAGTYGTGLLATVDASVAAATAWVAKLGTTGAGWAGAGQGCLLLRPSMTLEGYTGASLTQAAFTIDSIVNSTRTINTTAAVTMTAGDNVYIAKSYGQNTVPNGIMGLIDDGEFQDLVHSVSRTTYPELKSMVLRNGGTLRVLTEDLLLTAGFLLRQNVSGSVDTLVMNTGQLHKYILNVRPTRYFDANGKAPKYSAGFDNEDTFKFYFDGRPIRLITSEDVAPRHVYGINMSAMRRVTLRKLGWLDHGGGSMFIQNADSGGLKTTRAATMYSLENIATEAPWQHFRIQDLSDPQLCGAAYGGADTL